jgi:hypothetical protein
MPENKFIIRVSGFALYFFSVLMVFFAYIIYLCVEELLEKGISMAPILLSIIIIWIEVYFYRFLSGQKIEISNGVLSTKVILPQKDYLFMPKVLESKINLKDIDVIVIAKLKYFEEHSNELVDVNLDNIISEYRNMYLPATIKGGIFTPPISMGKFLSFPLIYIRFKNKSQRGIIIPTKPFSKDGIKKIINRLKENGIKLVIEPALHLEKIAIDLA